MLTVDERNDTIILLDDRHEATERRASGQPPSKVQRFNLFRNIREILEKYFLKRKGIEVNDFELDM